MVALPPDFEHIPLLSLATLKQHLKITVDTKNAILNRYISQARNQVFAWLSCTESELITQFLDILEEQEIDEPGEDIPGTVAAQTVKDYLLWLEGEYPEMTRAQLDAFAPFIHKVGDLEDACIILCKSYAMEDGHLGTAETFGVSSITTSQGGTTKTASYKDMRYEARKRVLPHRQWL